MPKIKKKKKSFFKKFFYLITISSIIFSTSSFIFKDYPLVKDIRTTSVNIFKNIQQKIAETSKYLFNNIAKNDQIPDENPNNILISSFNIRILSDKSRSDREVALIGDIIKNYDIIAIQEVRDEKILKRLISYLQQQGIIYGYEISNPVGKTSTERYAYIYRVNKIKLSKRGKIYNDPDDKFIREPFYATFKAKAFDFTLSTIHVLVGRNEKERTPEIIELAQVYKNIQTEDPAEQDIILMGDFNMPPDDHGFQNLLAINSMTCLIKHPFKTTIGDVSLYDNIWFQKKYVKEFTGNAGLYKFDTRVFKGDIREAKRSVSDHRPIWGEFNITGMDDD